MSELFEHPTIEELEGAFLPDCADEAMAETPSMVSRCVNCPGRSGTEASRNEITTRLLSDCKRRRFPFFCHMTRSGEFCTHLCADWTEAVKRSESEGR